MSTPKEKSLSILSEYINLNALNSLNCELRNISSSLFLKPVNIILFNDEIRQDQSTTSQTPISENLTTAVESTTPRLRDDYDYTGALIYIVFILFWYAVFVIILLVIQTKKTEIEYYEDDDDDTEDSTAHNLLRKIRTEDVKRKALGNLYKLPTFFCFYYRTMVSIIQEDLVNPAFRKRMWDIYLDNPNSYKVNRFESKRIQQIDRKLKQYQSTISSNFNRDDHYKTIDISQLERQKSNNSNSKNEHWFLLKDYDKIDSIVQHQPVYHNNNHNNTITGSINNNSNIVNNHFIQTNNPHQETNVMPTKKDTSKNRFNVEKIHDENLKK
jgi:hypothetical protein